MTAAMPCYAAHSPPLVHAAHSPPLVQYAAGPALSIHGIPDIAEYKKGKELKKRAFDVVMRCKTPKEQLVLAEQIEKEQEALMARRNSFFSASLDR